MSQNTNENWNELLRAFELGLVTEEIKEYEYRIYYDNSGEILKTTCLKQDPIDTLSYIIVDKTAYNEFIKSPYYKVINNQLKKFYPNTSGYKRQLIKSDSGYKVVKSNPALLVDEDESFDQVEYYDKRN